MEDQPGTLPSQSKGRGPTRLKSITRTRGSDQKISIEFDPSTGNAVGPNRKQFKTFVGTLARSKVNILLANWDSADDTVKDQIWQSILVFFFLPICIKFGYHSVIALT